MEEERVHDWGFSRIWGETVALVEMVCPTVSLKAVAALANQEQGVSKHPRICMLKHPHHHTVALKAIL